MVQRYEQWSDSSGDRIDFLARDAVLIEWFKDTNGAVQSNSNDVGTIYELAMIQLVN